jgi:flagellin
MARRAFEQGQNRPLEKETGSMVLSVNTNIGAMIALQNLNSTNVRLEKAQLNITTGLKVNGPKDDASTFAIAQNLRGDVRGWQSVQIALRGGESTVNVAIEGGREISDLLLEMKAKVVQANQAGLDAVSRSAIHNDFSALRDQIASIVETAQFNGTNLIKSGASTLTVLSTVDGSTITISAQALDTTTLGIQTLDLTNSAAAATALGFIDSAIESVNSRLANLGSSAKRLEVQGNFAIKIVDILKAGVGNLVDADMAEESANLQSLQIKQQLGVQALSIANTSPQTILSLFQ